MQITRETTGHTLIRAFEPGRIRIGERWHTSNLILTPDSVLEDWTPAAADRITIGDLAPALSIAPELVVVGAGNEACVPDVDLMAALAAHGVGLEYMLTAAACRTFNVLMHEGRRVAAALIL